MKKLIFSTVLLSTLFSLPLSAVHYFSGQKEYLKNCRSKDCHGGGTSFVSRYTIERWTEILQNKGETLATIHLKTKDAEEFLKYLKSERYQKKLKYLRAFVVKFAKDSETKPVPY